MNNIKEFVSNFKNYNNKTAIMENIDGIFVSYSYEDFINDICKVSSYLIDKQYKKQNIAIIGENSYKWLVSFFGIILSDNIAVPIDKDNSKENLSELLDSLNIDLAFVSENKYIYFEENTVYPVVSFDDELVVNKLFALEELCKDNVVNVDDTACIILTSGSSGYNKAVMLSHKNIITNMKSILETKYIDGSNEKCLVSILPFHHSYELFCDALMCFMYGMYLVIDNNIRNYINNLITFKPDTHIIVPALLNFINKKTKLLKEQRFKIVVGGAAIDNAVYLEMINKGFSILFGYGMTEASPLISLKTNIDNDTTSCNLFLTGIKIGNMINHKYGEILIKGDNVTKGYYNDLESTKNSFTEDGWFKTGDLGYIENNKLYLAGRLKNTIILANGKNVQPEQIEDIISQKLMYIDDVVVIETKVNNISCIGAIVYSGYVDLIEDSNTIKNDIIQINKDLEEHKKISCVLVSNNPLPKSHTLKIDRQRASEDIDKYKKVIVR